MSGAACPFCDPAEPALWQGQHYQVLADAYPICAGHVLLVTRQHFASHMHAPPEWLSEFEAAQDRVRRFLCDSFGQAGFLENGGRHQQVPHAHLHGLPFDARPPAGWLEAGRLRRVGGWDAVRRQCEQAGSYTYVEGLDERYVLASDGEYGRLLAEMRRQIAEQALVQHEPGTGRIRRAGKDVVAQTIALWNAWSAAQ